jgi:hypothetical protein
MDLMVQRYLELFEYPYSAARSSFKSLIQALISPGKASPMRDADV